MLKRRSEYIGSFLLLKKKEENKVIISHVSDGPKAKYSLNGSVLTVGDVVIDLQDKQRSTERVIDICLDNGLKTMREGLSAWYVANIIVPARQYVLQATGEKDDEDNDVMEEIELPVNTAEVELRLWGLPPQYFENQATNTEEVEGVTE